MSRTVMRCEDCGRRYRLVDGGTMGRCEGCVLTCEKVETRMETWRGNAIEKRGGTYYYVDTGEPVADTHTTRACGACGLKTGNDGHDPCLGTLPGVQNACCGHGDDDTAYVQLTSGECIGGLAALCWVGNHLGPRWRAKLKT